MDRPAPPPESDDAPAPRPGEPLGTPGSAAVVRLAAELLREGTGVALRVGGVSMAPFLKTGDVVTLQPTRAARVGEVVARLSGCERLLVHRAVTGGERPLTRGDSAVEVDPALAAGELLARVTRAEREGRRLRLGLGPERRLLAWLSLRGWLRPLLATVRRGLGGGHAAQTRGPDR